MPSKNCNGHNNLPTSKNIGTLIQEVLARKLERGSPSLARARGNLVGRGIANSISFTSFEQYLKAQNKRNFRHIICYTKRYHNVLETQDASLLLQAKPSVRPHAMESLATWSKFIGAYEQWQEIKSRYSLHWANGDESLQAIHRYFKGDNLEDMLQRIREMVSVLPPSMSKIVHWGRLLDCMLVK